MTSEIDTVVFDLGNVLVNWDPLALFRAQQAGDEQAVAAFIDETRFYERNIRGDSGVHWDVLTAEVEADAPQHAHAFSEYPVRFREALVGNVPGSVEVLEELRDQGTRLLALTNWATRTFNIAKTVYPWFEWFDGIVASGDVGVVKPDPAVYAILIERYAVDPARAVFIDDREENVVGAQQAGMSGLVFTDAATMRADLAALGILPA